MVSLSLKATDLGMEKFKPISTGQYNVIVDTPEAWLDDDRWKAVLSSHIFRKNVVCVVIDEAHKVSWGESSPDGVIFRAAFSRIGIIRSFCSNMFLFWHSVQLLIKIIVNLLMSRVVVRLK